MGIPQSLSGATHRRLCIQGYGACSHEQLAAYRFGIRFAYLSCAAIAATGLILASVPLLAALLVTAFLGMLLPNHPLDYVYNYGVRQLLGRPKLPRRTAQIRFACGVATVWLALTIWMFWAGWTTAAQVWGFLLVAVATLVGTTDICLPSMAYNWLTNRRIYPRGCMPAADPAGGGARPSAHHKFDPERWPSG